MGFTFSRRERIGRGTTLDISRSGASASEKAGRVAVSSRDRGSIRIAKGLSFRFQP